MGQVLGKLVNSQCNTSLTICYFLSPSFISPDKLAYGSCRPGYGWDKDIQVGQEDDMPKRESSALQILLHHSVSLFLGWEYVGTVLSLIQ
ncbi:hypothetical protein EON65_54660 [archaeon]|nr:MAG: hypothetical protein EON65_54660 [archaeon]